MATATVLPVPRTTFFDASGSPLAGGFVSTFIPSTTTAKQTWQDLGETISNANPVVLDSAGSALLYGSGAYQLTVTDSLGNAVPGMSGVSQAQAFVSDAMLPVVGALTTAAAETALGISPAMQPVVAGATISLAQVAFGISLAMQPVVGAATTAAAAAAMGTLASVATIAALRASAGTMPPAVYVDGYTTQGDGGNGVFVYVSTDHATADNGGTVIVDALLRRWYRDLEGELPSVKYWGAVGDGATDDAAAFNAAFASGAAGLSIPAGKYMLHAGLTYTMPTTTSTFRIVGAGPEVTQLIWTISAGLTCNFIGQYNSIDISDFSMLAPGVNTATALTLAQTAVVPNSGDSPRNSLTNITFRGTDAYGAKNNCWAKAVECAISNVNYYGLHVIGSAGTVGLGVMIENNASPTVIHNFVSCYFQTCDTGIYYGSNVQGVSVVGCNFIVRLGIQNTGGLPGLDQLAVTNSQFAATQGCIELQSAVSNVICTGNLFILASNAFGIYLASANVFLVVGNSFVPDAASVNHTGVGILANILPGLITGNMFSDINLGLSLAAGSANINVQSNIYSNVSTHITNLGAGNTIGGGSP